MIIQLVFVILCPFFLFFYLFFFRDFPVHKKERRVDPQRISRHTVQSLNVKRLARFRIARNSGDIIRSENKNITTMRLDEVVGELVHKDLIARIDRTARDDLTAAIGVSRKNIEIVPQSVGRSVNQKAFLFLANHAREGEEEQIFLYLHLKDLIVLARDDGDVISAAHHEFSDLLKKTRQRCCWFYFVTDDSVECRLH